MSACLGRNRLQRVGCDAQRPLSAIQPYVRSWLIADSQAPSTKHFVRDRTERAIFERRRIDAARFSASRPACLLPCLEYSAQSTKYSVESTSNGAQEMLPRCVIDRSDDSRTKRHDYR
jgi:hypothetical protein